MDVSHTIEMAICVLSKSAQKRQLLLGTVPLYLLDSASALLFVFFVPFRVYQRARIKSRTRKKVQELRVLTLPPKSFQDTMLLKPPITSIQIGLICTSAMTLVEVSTSFYILMSSFSSISIQLSSNESRNKDTWGPSIKDVGIFTP